MTEATVATAVASPCNDVCTIDAASGWCMGCMRTMAEIAAWGGLDEAAKTAVWRQLPLRRAEFDADVPRPAP